MRSKPIISTIAFITAFAASAAVAGLFSSPDQAEIAYVSIPEYKSTSCFKYKNGSITAEKISVLIRKDNDNGRLMEKDLKNFDGESSTADPSFARYAEAVERYVDASSNLETNDLPGDFQALWRDHIKAWRDYSEFLKKSSDRKVLIDEEFKIADRNFNREIKLTFRKVQRSGAGYGAKVY